MAGGCGAWSDSGDGRGLAAEAWRLAGISRRWSEELKAALRALHDMLVSSKFPCLDV